VENSSEPHRHGKVSRVAEFGLIGAIANWCECLQGATTIRGALKYLLLAVDAEAISLARISRDRNGETLSINVDRLAVHSNLPRLHRSYAAGVLGKYIHCPKTGSIWLYSMVDDDLDPALGEFHHRRSLSELAVVTLATSEKSIDFFELHFSQKLNHDSHAMLNLTVPTLVETWKNRKPGLLTEAALGRMQVQRRTPNVATILSCDNPARLSRAEFRLCVFLSRGYSNESARRELGISDSTLRTHLRSVYQKTGASSLPELLYQLLSKASDTSSVSSLVA